jgi:uncharacterized protein (DUF2252 family)
MSSETRRQWHAELTRDQSEDLDAPSWLWSAVVGLLVSHEETYLEHCRRYVLPDSEND